MFILLKSLDRVHIVLTFLLSAVLTNQMLANVAAYLFVTFAHYTHSKIIVIEALFCLDAHKGYISYSCPFH